MWHFWNGYVIIQIEGLSAARFLRRLSDAGVRVSDVYRAETGELYATVQATRFKMLHRARRGLRLRVHIVKRGGLPFVLRKLFRRPFLWAGSAVLMCALCVLSARIWTIRIDRTERVDPNEILTMLDERGIRPGARPEGPVLITAAEDIAAQIREAAWIGLDREGITLHVRIVESIPESVKKTDRVPSDVLAEKDGVVLSVNVMRGQARVKEGDRVKKGDVLISGTVHYKDQTVETSADGVVTAAVQYAAEAEVEQSVNEPQETDRTETVKVLRFAGHEIVKNEPSFEHYSLSGSVEIAVSPLLPVTIEKRTAREIVNVERTLSPQEADEIALMRARAAAYALVPKDAAIVNTYGTIYVRDGKRYAAASVTAEEIIGITEEKPHDE